MSHTFTHKEDETQTVFIFNGDLSGDVVVKKSYSLANGMGWPSTHIETSTISGEALVALFDKYRHVLPITAE